VRLLRFALVTLLAASIWGVIIASVLGGLVTALDFAIAGVGALTALCLTQWFECELERRRHG
jgi:hypothetical protein